MDQSLVTPKLKKFEFFTNLTDLFDNVIRPGCLTVSSHTIDSICNLQTLSNITELRLFLGLCNIIVWFVRNFARIAVSLKRILRKASPLSTRNYQKRSFEAIKMLNEKLLSPPLLDLPPLQGTYTVNKKDND